MENRASTTVAFGVKAKVLLSLASEVDFADAAAGYSVASIIPMMVIH